MKVLDKIMITFLCSVLLMTAHAQSSHWQVNVYDYRYDLTVYFALDIDGVTVSDFANYEVASFVGDECRGVGRVLTQGDNQYGYLRVYSNDEYGETVTFKVYDKNNAREYDVKDVSLTFKSQTVTGMPSTPLMLSVSNQDIIPIVLNSEGYATFSYSTDVEVEGAEVYTATMQGNLIKCTQSGQGIPAYTGVILKGEPNAKVTLTVTTGLNILDGNELMATTTANGLAQLETALVLSGKVFKNYTGSAFVPDKAYIPYEGNANNSFTIVFDNITSALSIGSNDNILDVTTVKTIENDKLIIKTANGKYSTIGTSIK